MILLIWGNKQTNKKDTNELVYKREIDPQTQKTNLWLPMGKVRGEINEEFEINIYSLLYIT